MRSNIREQLAYFRNWEYLKNFFTTALFLLVSLVVNYYAGIYASEKASSSVTDIVLSNIPVYDVDGIFVYGAIAMWVFVTLLAFSRPRHIPFTFKAVSLFVLIRSVFISLTHIGPFPNEITLSSNAIHYLTNGGDLFFSAHTGLPFLLAMIFWEFKYLRHFFLICSVLFGVVVLMGHLHYSIDVLSAFFITYAIYHLARFFIPEVLRLFRNGLIKSVGHNL